MAPLPKDVPKRRVIKTLERLGFRLVREHEHISWNGTTPTAHGRR
jgi:hypothetical protein